MTATAFGIVTMEEFVLNLTQASEVIFSTPMPITPMSLDRVVNP
jgi:hypothetical protein